MAHRTTDKVKLGLFVIAGGIFLIALLYMIGRKENLFGNTFTLKARFANSQGLTPGNNVRFSGIQVGTVKSVHIIDDSTIEVSMRIERSMQQFIKTNALASIGTDGLIGNKVINILPGKTQGQPVKEDDVLASRTPFDTDAMLKTLEETNKDIGIAASSLRQSITKLNNSTALWKFLGDEQFPDNLRMSAANIRSASYQTQQMTTALNQIINGVKSGKGSLGAIITDTTIAAELTNTLARIKSIGDNAEDLASSLKTAIGNIENQIENGNGTVHALLKDTALSQSLAMSLKNIETGTAAFSQNMEALKHNFLFRGYFRRLEREQNKKK